MGLRCTRCCLKRKVKRFTHRELEDMKVAFDLMDTNKDGTLSLEEFEKSAAMIGQKWSIPTWQNRLEKAGFEKNITEIDFKTFVKIIYSSRQKITTAEDEYKYIFDIFDKNKDGFVSADELRRTMQCVGIDMTEEMIRGIFKGETMDYKGFCELMKKTWHVKNHPTRQ